MAKKKFKLSNIVGMLVGVVASIGVGELFIGGSMLDGVILGLLPLLVHQIVGWTIIGGSILSLVSYLMNN